MNNTAVIAKLTNVRPHPNADRLKLATVLGNQVVVGLSAYEGETGVYFDSNLQLSEAFANANDLIRRKNPTTGKQEGGMFDENRKVRTQKFRGEISDGFWCPLEYLSKVSEDTTDVTIAEGYEFTTWRGVEICSKFVPKHTLSSNAGGSMKAQKANIMFKQHFDTEHLGKHLSSITPGCKIIFTEKLHGTSQRVANVLVEKKLSKFAKWGYSWLMKLGIPINTMEWQHLVGTRRVVLDMSYKSNSGFHSDSLREVAASPFTGILRPGETIYYEVVGYDPSNGMPIMPPVSFERLSKVLSPNEIKHLQAISPTGDSMHFSYNCSIGELDVYVYRITLTDENGHSYELPWSDVKSRCRELGVKYVPEIDIIYWSKDPLEEGIITHDKILELANLYSEQPNNTYPHYSEGCCIRIESEDKAGCEIFKHKSFIFKYGEGIIKEANILDEEDKQSLLQE